MTLQLNPNLPLISADRMRIRQILNNLVTNSLEALEARPARASYSKPRWPTTARTGSIRRDRGGRQRPGIQRDLIGTVFDPYVTSKPKARGLGWRLSRKSWKSTAAALKRIISAREAPRVRILLPLGDGARSAGSAKPRTGEHRRERV